MPMDNQEFSPIKLRNREVEDILNDPPHWFVRVGGYMMFLLVVVIIGICMLISYPDTIKSDVDYNADNRLFYMSLPYSNLSAAAPVGAEVRIELENRPRQQYGYCYATLVGKSYSARTQSYTLTFKPRSAKGLDRPTSGVGTIVVRERNLFERFCETIRF